MGWVAVLLAAIAGVRKNQNLSKRKKQLVWIHARVWRLQLGLAALHLGVRGPAGCALLYTAPLQQWRQDMDSCRREDHRSVRAGIIRDCKPAGIRRGEEREHERAAAESPGEKAPALTATH